MRIAEAYDCETCEVRLSQPIIRNLNIIELYDLLPRNYDGMSGRKVITAADIDFVFRLQAVPEELRDDYYMRLMFFHESLIEALEAGHEAARKAAGSKRAAAGAPAPWEN